jgi:hypothetical protein
MSQAWRRPVSFGSGFNLGCGFVFGILAAIITIIVLFAVCSVMFSGA